MYKKIIDYENSLNKINLSVSGIESVIKDFSLEFPSVRNETVEHKMRVPMFVYPFYRFVIEGKQVPYQEQYWRAYAKHNRDWFDSVRPSNEIIEGLKARAFRTYPSLMRDLHFAKLVSEQNYFDEVIYNQDLDIKRGVDLLLKKDGKVFAVNLYTQTSRAYTARKKKESRHEKLDEDVLNIEFPVAFKGSKQCGQFFLYDIDDFERLKKLCA